MTTYKITYSIFGWPYYKTETYHTNVRATDENQAIEILKKDLKTNGHRLHEVIGIEVNE